MPYVDQPSFCHNATKGAREIRMCSDAPRPPPAKSAAPTTIEGWHPCLTSIKTPPPSTSGRGKTVSRETAREGLLGSFFAISRPIIINLLVHFLRFGVVPYLGLLRRRRRGVGFISAVTGLAPRAVLARASLGWCGVARSDTRFR